MKRRSFLGFLGGAAAVPFVKMPAAAEALVEVPAMVEPEVVVAAVGRNTIISPKLFSRYALSLLKENLALNDAMAELDANG